MPSQHANPEAAPQTPCGLPFFAYALSPGKENRSFFLITPLHRWCFDFNKCNKLYPNL